MGTLGAIAARWQEPVGDGKEPVKDEKKLSLRHRKLAKERRRTTRSLKSYVHHQAAAATQILRRDKPYYFWGHDGVGIISNAIPYGLDILTLS